MPSVRLAKVTKRFGRINAIDNLDLEIEDGEYLCVLGPTGSGKTTLLRLIAGIVKPNEGEIYIDGKLMNDVPPQERNTAIVPQDYALFPHLNVIENATFGPISRDLRRKEAYDVARRMLEMTRLAGRADSFPSELSGGMQQRLALARALASGASLLLLDEPLGALDARLRVELRYKLRSLVKDEGFTAIHVTHDQEEAMVVGDRIVVLRQGQIQQGSIPFTIYNEPKSIFIANFVGSANFLEGFISERGPGWSRVQLRNGMAVRVRETGYSPGERVVLAIREEMIEIVRAAKRKAGVNLFRGIVRSTSFLGSFIRYEIQLENGDVVNSKIPVFLRDDKVLSGQRVDVRLQAENIKTYLYPATGLYRELEAV